MGEELKNTFTAYLGHDFQTKLMWQLLVEPEFAEKTIDKLAVEYFDDPYLKRLFIIYLEYYKEFEKVPNLQNKSIEHAIAKYKSPTSTTEEEILTSVIDKIKLWNENVLNKNQLYDGDVVQKDTNNFIKQQEYRKLGEYIITKTKNGEIKQKNFIHDVDEKFTKIINVGVEEDFGTEVVEDIENALRREFRQTIPTGVIALDEVTGGGLGRGEIGLILAPSGVGKALPNSHKVLTPKGWVENGNLKIGDDVYGSDGKPQKILGVYPQGSRKIYKIEFSDNTESYCDAEHLWSVNSFKQRSAKTRINNKSVFFPDTTFQVLKTSEMMNDFKLKDDKLNYRLPNVKPIEFEEIEVPINPYVLGALLGDGCLTNKNQPHLITSDEFIKDKVMSLCENSSFSKYKGRFENYKDLYRVSILNSRKIFENNLKLYGTDSSSKFIPEIYLRNSIKNRELLLQGLIDTDGTLQSNSTIIYTTISEKLSENVRELVLSLGGTCRINKREKYYRNKRGEKINGKLSYNLTISFPPNGIIPCTLPNKLERFKCRNKYEFNKFIKNIEYSHNEEATCIYVENNDHLYVIDDYILTHNTTLLTRIANTAYEDGKNVLQIIFEDTPDQIKRKHYTIWSKVRLSEIDDNREIVADKVKQKIEKIENYGGKLVIKRFSQDGTTLPDIKNWILRYQKKFGIKFDIVVLDYLDKVESHRRVPDRNEAELAVVRAFEALAGDFNIPCWSAIQGNRSSIGSEFVEAQQTGGSIKRMQIAHFFMSIAKTPDQQESGQANIRILKARFAQDGQTWTNCIFDNDSMEIRITDPIRKRTTLQKYDTQDIEKLEKKSEKINEDTGKFNSKVSSEFKGPTIEDMTKNKGGEKEKQTDEKENTINNVEEKPEIPQKSAPEEKSYDEIKNILSDDKDEKTKEERNNHLYNLMKEMADNQGKLKKD